MKVTKNKLADYLGVEVSQVVQLGSKQLFIVGGSNLYSYFTLVGLLGSGVWRLTEKKFSSTTTRQLSWFRANYETNALETSL